MTVCLSENSSNRQDKPVCKAVLASLVTNIQLPAQGKNNLNVMEYIILVISNFQIHLNFRSAADYRDSNVSAGIEYYIITTVKHAI